jgi:hypothetical protein
MSWGQTKKLSKAPLHTLYIKSVALASLGPKNQSAFDVSLGNVVAEGVREAH